LLNIEVILCITTGATPLQPLHI